MSLNCTFEKFRETRRIRGAIMHKHTGPKDFKMAVYCIEDDIDLLSEQKRLFDICEKYGVGYSSSEWDINFDTSKIDTP